MFELLDQAIEFTQGPSIISAQHDSSQINWLNGMSDPGEMIGCGMYQQLRRGASESDAMYYQRVNGELAKIPADHRAKIEAFGRKAALQRANLATSNGKICLMSAGKLPWSELGVSISSAANADQALQYASLAWSVEKRPLGYFDAAGVYHETATSFAIVRGDNGAHLGTVGRRYEPFQNRDAAEFIDEVLQSAGAKYETAGALGSGERIWFLANVPAGTFTVQGDENLQYLLISNCHDGSGCIQILPTSVRVECQNTHRQALAGTKDKAFSIRHTKNAAIKVDACRKALGIVNKSAEQYKSQVELLASRQVGSAQLATYFDDMLDVACEVSAAEAKLGAEPLALALELDRIEQAAAEKRIAKQIEKRKGLLEEMLTVWESERCGKGIAGSAWAAFNAVSDVADHSKELNRYKGTGRERAESRFVSATSGRNDEIKQTAFSAALQLAN